MGNKPVAGIIFNPTKKSDSQLRQIFQPIEDKYGWGPSKYFSTTEDDPGVGQAIQAVQSGVDVVVACGGDGTVRATAEGLIKENTKSDTDKNSPEHTRGMSVPLGIVPQGTGNLLARNLKLPLEAEKSFEIALTGNPTHIDYGLATTDDKKEIPFLVMAGIGLDAQMIVNTDDRLKKKAGILAYIKAVFMSLRGGDRVQSNITVDDMFNTERKAHTVMVGNCGELVGSISLIPEATPNDGFIHLAVLRAKGILGWIQIVAQLVANLAQKVLPALDGAKKRRSIVNHQQKGPLKTKAVSYAKGQKIVVKLDRLDDFEVDGEVVSQTASFTCRIVKAGLSVKVDA